LAPALTRVVPPCRNLQPGRRNKKGNPVKNFIQNTGRRMGSRQYPSIVPKKALLLLLEAYFLIFEEDLWFKIRYVISNAPVTLE
jgi:hypothetical protein